MIKSTAASIAPAVTNPFNLSLSLGRVPSEWNSRSACVTPVPKSSKFSDPANYRPVSLLSILSILANRPGISGTVPETDLLSCCPRNNQNCPRNYTRGLGVYYVQASCLTNYYLQMSASTSGSARLEPVSKKAMHASGIPIGNAIMCPQAEREPLSSVVKILSRLPQECCCENVLHKTAKSCKISEIFLHIQNSGLGSMTE